MSEVEIPIVLEGVAKAFQGREILRDVSLEVRRGETVVLFGPSGCGKTLILKICMGLIRPDRGRVLLDGQDVVQMETSELNRLRRSCGMLFQYYALFDSMSVEENIGFFLREQLRLPADQRRQRVDQLLESIDLVGTNNLRIAELSGGMQKRVGIARALAHRPRLVFYDSPTDGLDPMTADRINDLILELGRETGVTSLAVSNDMATAYKIGSRVGMLYEGRIRQLATPAVIQSTDDPYVRQFVEGLEEGPIHYM